MYTLHIHITCMPYAYTIHTMYTTPTIYTTPTMLTPNLFTYYIHILHNT